MPGWLNVYNQWRKHGEKRNGDGCLRREPRPHFTQRAPLGSARRRLGLRRRRRLAREGGLLRVVPLEQQRVERGGSLEGVAVRSAWVGRMSLW